MISKVTNPSGALIIWNYKNRFDANTPNEDPHSIEQVIINSASLMGMSTQKHKSKPAGNFSCTLAPTKNWTAIITPGSWCALLISRNKISSISQDNIGTANEESFRMLGRIDSCRLAVTVDDDGTRYTQYIVTGRDWGSVFDTKVYLDPVFINSVLSTAGSIGHAARLLLDDLVLSYNKGNLPTSTDVVKSLIKIWASISDVIFKKSPPQPSPAIPGFEDVPSFNFSPNSSQQGSQELPIKQAPGDLLIGTDKVFTLPKEVATFMKQGPFTGAAASFYYLIQLYSGVLTGYDNYDNGHSNDYGIPSTLSLSGAFTLWQILIDNANLILNELVTDIKFVNGDPVFALYKRVKPFINRNLLRDKEGAGRKPQVIKNISKFKHVKRTLIPKEDVISIDAGTNWRQRVNFIEIQFSPSLFSKQHDFNVEGALKAETQLRDDKSYARDGFLPLTYTTNYIVYDNDKENISSTLEWKYLLREWYFNTHIMLNGVIKFIGQNTYIQVGDNIMIDSSVMGDTSFNEKQNNSSQLTYLLAHVESISHELQVDNITGARSFITTVHFIRGVITDQNGEILGRDGSLQGVLDLEADALTSSGEKINNTLATSTQNDPDTDKLKGR